MLLNTCHSYKKPQYIIVRFLGSAKNLTRQNVFNKEQREELQYYASSV